MGQKVLKSWCDFVKGLLSLCVAVLQFPSERSTSRSQELRRQAPKIERLQNELQLRDQGLATRCSAVCRVQESSEKPTSTVQYCNFQASFQKESLAAFYVLVATYILYVSDCLPSDCLKELIDFYAARHGINVTRYRYVSEAIYF